MVSACLGEGSSTSHAQVVEVGETRVSVLIADSPEERQTGLKDVETIPGGADGMLFVHDSPSQVNFIMLDVSIPLDIWFFDPEGVMVGSAEMAPCPSEPCPLYSSPGEVSWVLETAAGAFDFDDGVMLTGAPTLP